MLIWLTQTISGDETMKSCTLAILANIVMFGICGGSDRVLANDDLKIDQSTQPPAVAKKREKNSSVSSARPRRSQPHQKTAETDSQNNGTAKGQPWFDVDSDRARVPTAAKEPAPAKGTPAVKWAKDPVDFNYKVNGDNDFRMLPRFDPTQSPEGAMGRGEGASGEVGMNLHF